MTAAALVQAVVVGVGVAWSALFAARRLMPTTTRRVRAMLAGALAAPSRPAWLRQVAARLQPHAAVGGASCGGGCASCGGCATAAAAPRVEARALEFRPRTAK